MAVAKPVPRLLLGYTMMVVTALLWAGAWITAKVAAYDAPPYTVATGRFLVGAAALVPLWLTWGRRERVSLHDQAAWRALAAMALLGGALYNVFFLVGERWAPAADGGILTPGVCAVSITVLAALLARKAPARRAVVGVLLSLAGTAAIGVLALGEAEGSSRRAEGNLLFALAGLSFGAYTIFNRSISQRVPAFTAVLTVNLLAALMLAPAAWMSEGLPDLAAWSGAAIGNLLYLGIGSTALAQTTFYLAVRFLGVTRMAPTLGLVPVFTTAMAALFLDEPITALHVLGSLLVLAGIAAPSVTLGGRSQGVAAPAPAEAPDR